MTALPILVYVLDSLALYLLWKKQAICTCVMNGLILYLRKYKEVIELKLSRTYRKITFGRGDPEVGTASIKYNSEVLGWCSNTNLPKVLSIQIVLQWHKLSIWIIKTMILAHYTTTNFSLHLCYSGSSHIIEVQGPLLQTNSHRAMGVNRKKRTYQSPKTKSCPNNSLPHV